MTTTTDGPFIRSVGRALPANYVDQETLIAAFRRTWGRAHFNVERLEELHRAVRVGGRHLALPIEEYESLASLGERNAAWLEAATELGEAAVRSALERAGLGPGEVDHLLFVTTTGISTPSLDARLVNRLGLSEEVKRTPIFGLGCAAGAAGLARASDTLRAFPGQVSLLLSVELCSLTLQRDDLSIANIVSSGLFGDGAAAVVLEGGSREPRGKGISPAALARSWSSLRETGNLSSASVLFVLGELLSMGPGFCSEMVLLRW